MIKSVTVINYRGEQLTMELRNPEKSGFLIQEITGLGPVEATVNTTDILSLNGSVFNSSRLTSRNIVLTLQYLWANTIENARMASYKWFKIGEKCTLVIETDSRKAMVEGWVEKNEPVIFSEAETTQISIICPDSYMYAYNDGNASEIDFTSVTKMFSFPFSNPEGERTLIFGEVNNVFTQTVYYDGDADSGLVLRAKAIDDVTSNIILTNQTTEESIAVDMPLIASTTGSSMMAGDILTIDTRKGHKAAILQRGVGTLNVLYALTPDSKWLTLSNGYNTFKLSTATAIQVNSLQAEIEYRIAYEGV